MVILLLSIAAGIILLLPPDTPLLFKGIFYLFASYSVGLAVWDLLNRLNESKIKRILLVIVAITLSILKEQR